MASAGGHWTKATGGPNKGKNVFVPAPSTHKVIMVDGEVLGLGIQQGSLAYFGDPEKAGSYSVVNVDDGNILISDFENAPAAYVAMLELNEKAGGAAWAGGWAGNMSPVSEANLVVPAKIWKGASSAEAAKVLSAGYPNQKKMQEIAGKGSIPTIQKPTTKPAAPKAPETNPLAPPKYTAPPGMFGG